MSFDFRPYFQSNRFTPAQAETLIRLLTDLQLQYQRDDLTAGAGDDTITLAGEPVALKIYEDGVLRAESSYTVTGLLVDVGAATGGEVFTVEYWSRNPGPSIIS